MGDHGYAEALFELGSMGLTRDAVRQLMNEAVGEADKVHGMGAQGWTAIPGTKKWLVYDSGIDGMDYTWSIRNPKAEPLPKPKDGEVYVVIVEDRHADTEASVFSKATAALSYAFDQLPEEYEEALHDGWREAGCIFNKQYGESDYVRVMRAMPDNPLAKWS